MITGTFVSKEYIKLINNSSDPADTQETQELSLDPVTWTEQTRFVRGDKFTFDDREYLHQIYRDTAKRIYVKKGRQTEISEWLINMILINAWKYPGTVHVYIADRQSHSYKFSNQRMKIEAIKHSELIQKIVKLKNHTTTKMILNNGSIVYFMSAWNGFIEAESVPADFGYIDEIQNMDLLTFASFISSMSHSKHQKLYGVGIGTIEGSEWDKIFLDTTMNRWDSKAKAWIPKKPDKEYSGYLIPQTIVPWITAADIEKSRREFPPAQFAIQVMGESVKGDAVPLSLADMKKVLIPGGFTMPDDVDHSLGPVTIGIDLGGGTKAFTVPYIEQWIDTNIGISKLLYTTRITDVDTESQLYKLGNLIDRYEPDIGAIDLGGGTRQMQGIEDKYGHIIVKCNYSAPLQTPYVYNKISSNNLLKVNRSYLLEQVFAQIKDPHIQDGNIIRKIQIPFKDNPEEINWLLNDFTAMFGSIRKSASGQEQTIYDKSPTVTNDALMAKGFSTASFQLFKRNNLDNESFVDYN